MDLTAQNITIDDLQGDQKEIAEAVGLEIYLILVDAFGGGQIYIAKRDKLTAIARNNAIEKEFNGFNFSELAKKYNLSERMIRRIIEEKRNALIGQFDIFDYVKKG